MRVARDATIPTRPTVSPLALAGPGRGRLPPPLDGDNVGFYPKARNAIWHIVKALAVAPDESVLVPSYNCGAELDAVLKAQARARFYRVDRSARIDLDQLRSAVDATTRAVLVTHYFGFPQPDLAAIADLCRTRGLILIEDCAHALYSQRSGRPLGTFGDVGVFSLWKTLPLPDGAASLQNGAVAVRGGVERPPLHGSLGWIRASVQARAAARYGRVGSAVHRHALGGVGAVAKRAIPRQPPPPSLAGPDSDPHVTFEPGTAAWTISSPSLRIARRSDHAGIPARRRRNYAVLAAELEELPRLGLLHAQLPDGVCPLCLPVLVDDAGGLQEHLRRRGIGAETFWSDFHPAFPAGEFPDAAHLKRHVVALPIHQDVDASALDRMATAVREWERLR